MLTGGLDRLNGVQGTNKGCKQTDGLDWNVPCLLGIDSEALL